MTTKCGVKIRILDDGPFAWEVENEINDAHEVSYVGGSEMRELPNNGYLKSRASSSATYFNGKMVIFAICSADCPHNPIFKGPIFNHGDGDRFSCYCELEGETFTDDHAKYCSWHFQRYLDTGTQYCACVKEGEGGKPEIRMETDWCKVFHPHGCEAEICFVTKKPRDLTVVNILADIKYKVDEGMLTEHEVVKKGIRLYGNMIKEIADRKIAEIMEAPETLKWTHGRLLMGQIPTRIYAAKGNGKDLLQDLQDAREGLEVIHANDTVKADKKAKQERRKAYKEAKKRGREKRTVKNMKAILQDDTASEVMKEWAEMRLQQRGITVEREPEQLTLF